MSKFEVDSIYREVGTFGTIGIKHRVVMFSKDGKYGKNKSYVRQYVSSKSNGGKAGLSSFLYRGTADSIVIETKDYENKDSVKMKNTIYLSYSDISEVERVCKEAISWFENPQIKNDLFQYENNNPYKISDKYSSLHAIMYPIIGINGAFLVIQPAVITDFKTRMGYPGVLIKSITGVVGCCTITEFKSMVIVLMSSLRDLYKLSLDLINHYMLDQIIGG